MNTMPNRQPSTHSDDLSDSDIWGSDSEVTLESPDIAKLRKLHHKQGYLEGITKAKESTLQHGFDTGYPQGAALGIEIGEIVGSLQIWSAQSDERGERAKELLMRAKRELHISKVLSWRYFDDELNLPEKGHPLILQWRELLDSLRARQ